MPTILCLFLIFGIWLHYEKSKSSKKETRETEDFWEREKQANFVRKKDISNLSYISIPLTNLPMNATTDTQLNCYYKTIQSLSTSKILNLSRLSNTDIKMTYGQSNFTLLSAYDENYNTLTVTLNKWGTYLYNHDNLTDAKSVLEYAVTIGCDISNVYITLGNIYSLLNETNQFDKLLKQASNLDTVMKTKITDSLEQIKLERMLES